MYHAYVEKRVRELFDAVNRGQPDPVFAMFGAEFEHIFLGRDHALGGKRTKLESVRRWYGRLYRLLPDIHFNVTRVTVCGGPWHTIAVAEWIETNSGTDGVVTTANGHNIVFLRWGAAYRLIIAPDTRKLSSTLHRLACLGVGEAAVGPIID